MEADVLNRSLPHSGQSWRESILSASLFFPILFLADTRIHPSHPHAPFEHPQTAYVIHTSLGKATSLFFSSKRSLNLRGYGMMLFCRTLKISRRRGGDIVWKAGDIPALAVSTGSPYVFQRCFHGTPFFWPKTATLAINSSQARPRIRITTGFGIWTLPLWNQV